MAFSIFPNWNRRQRDQQAAAQPGQPTGSISPSMASNIKSRVKSAVLKQLGSFGTLIEAILRPNGKSLADNIDQEIDAALHLEETLRNSQPTVVNERQEPARISSSPPVPPDEHLYNEYKQPPLVEGPILVSSSNVYSIGFAHPL